MGLSGNSPSSSSTADSAPAWDSTTKSLIRVRDGDNFLDFIARQILHLRGHGRNRPTVCPDEQFHHPQKPSA